MTVPQERTLRSCDAITSAGMGFWRAMKGKPAQDVGPASQARDAAAIDHQHLVDIPLCQQIQHVERVVIGVGDDDLIQGLHHSAH